MCFAEASLSHSLTTPLIKMEGDDALMTCVVQVRKDDNVSDNDDNDSDDDVIDDNDIPEPAQPDADVEAGDPREGWHQDPDCQHRRHHLRPQGLRHPRGRGPGVRPGHQVRHDDGYYFIQKSHFRLI